jgi:hypothetical protein
MAIELPIEIGADVSYVLEIDDLNDAQVTTYNGTETLTCACWRGDDQAVLFAPAVSWATAALGQFNFAVSAAQSGTLTPGRYNLQLTITSGGVARKKTFGWLIVKPSPGSATARPVYQTWDETKFYAGSWLEKLQRLDTDQTGFAEERGRARASFEQLLHNAWRGDNVVVRQTRFAFPYGVNWANRRSPLRDPQLITWLAANQLLVTDEIKEWCAYATIALICRRQINPMKDDGYGAAASWYATRADTLAATLTPEIDTDGDGLGDIPIPLGTIDMLKG